MYRIIASRIFNKMVDISGDVCIMNVNIAFRYEYIGIP